DIAVEPDGVLAALHLRGVREDGNDVALVRAVRVVRVEVGRDLLVDHLAQPDVVDLEDVGDIRDLPRLAQLDALVLRVVRGTGEGDGDARMRRLELRLGVRRPRLDALRVDGVLAPPDG